MTLATRPVLVLLAAVVACGLVVGGAMVLAAPLGAVLAGWAPHWQEAVFALILYGVLAGIALVGRWMAGADHPTRSAPGWIALGALIGIGGLMLALVDAELAGGVVRGTVAGTAATLLLGTVVMIGQAASEELFFRGWLQPVLLRAWGPAVAIGVTALAFAGLHVAGGERSPLTLINLLLGGVLFGLLAWRSGSIAASIAAHAGWNWSEAIVFGLDPNPGAGSFGAFHDLDLSGGALWGGSAEGLNASVAMTLVMVAIILPLGLTRRARISAPSSVPG